MPKCKLCGEEVNEGDVIRHALLKHPKEPVVKTMLKNPALREFYKKIKKEMKEQYFEK